MWQLSPKAHSSSWYLFSCILFPFKSLLPLYSPLWNWIDDSKGTRANAIQNTDFLWCALLRQSTKVQLSYQNPVCNYSFLARYAFNCMNSQEFHAKANNCVLTTPSALTKYCSTTVLYRDLAEGIFSFPPLTPKKEYARKIIVGNDCYSWHIGLCLRSKFFIVLI